MATYYSFSIPSQRTWCRTGQQITGSKTWRGLVCAHMLSCFSHVQLFVTLWTVACQAPLSTGFSMDISPWTCSVVQITENEMVRWHQRLSGHEFEQIPGDAEGQGSLGCCTPWGHDLATEHIHGDMFPCPWRIPWTEEPGRPQSIQFIQISPYSSPDPPGEPSWPMSRACISCLLHSQAGSLPPAPPETPLKRSYWHPNS